MSHDALQFDDASSAWDQLSERVEAFVRAWEDDGAPPDVAAYLPTATDSVRRLAAVELIKVDLEYRWRKGPSSARVEDYLKRVPELAGGEMPFDLIYEEYHVRKQAGEPVDAAEYYRRFPRQATELARLLGESVSRSTSLSLTERIGALAPGEQLDDFDLLARLGQGTFASVFLALQRSLSRRVALKVSADRGDEPRTMAQLDHPHIVRVFDQRLLPDRKLRLLYMQYITGGTLEGVSDRVRRTPPAERTGALLLETVNSALNAKGEEPPAESSLRRRLAGMSWPDAVAWLGARLAAALHYAHVRGVLHRDLKPANVLLTAEGSPKLADFNISFCSKLDGASAAAFFGGSLAYMSPEQLEAYDPAHPRRPEELDGRSDIYALGVMLWELLTGRRPFDESLDGDYASAVQTLTARRHAGPDAASIRGLAQSAGERLAAILQKCLAPAADDRYADAWQLARDLELGQSRRLKQLWQRPLGGWLAFARRHPLLALAAAGVAPNLAASLLNIAYNYTQIYVGLGSAAKGIFVGQLLWVNPIAYLLAIFLVACAAWPVLKAVVGDRAVSARGELNAAPIRRRALTLGEWTAWVSAAEWGISGLIFPTWLAIATDAPLNAQHFVHFMTSQIVCGLMAALLSFFCVTFLLTRAFLPRLLHGDEDPQTCQGLRRLAARTRRLFLLTVSVPLVAMLPMVWTSTDRGAFGILAGVGLLSFLAAWRLAQETQQDIASLVSAAGPLDQSLAISETAEQA